MQGTLYIIAAPSGGGKSSLVKALLESTANLQVSVSYTTRPMRPREQEGVDYHFVDQARFDALRDSGVFLEHAEVFGHCYGTSRAWVMERLQQGTDVLLEIDWQGKHQIAQSFPEAVSIFVLPPSRAVLEQRLRARGQDGDEVIARRMQAATNEISHWNEFDYLVLNDDFQTAVADVQAIFRARRLRRGPQGARLQRLLAELLVQ
ncbi:MAG: guanylate kinase [Gammaproteobacteria bacterium]|nr:guanylate kinase [Gammaproteobacteria bacterium]